jgi:seryl-tRNA synthetase
MLDINFIRENAEKVKKATKAKGFDENIVDELLKVYEEFISKQREWENLNHLVTVNSARFLLLVKKGLDYARTSKEGKGLLKDAEDLKERRSQAWKEIVKLKPIKDTLAYKIPNIFADDVPIGKDESENKVVRKWGEPTKFDFEPKDHVALGKSLGIIDSETASKVTGTRFTYLKGDAVLLQNALYQFAVSLLTNEKELKKIAEKTEKGYSFKAFIPIAPPLFINPVVYEKMARLSPETEIERYAIPRDNQYLIGSAEHTLGPMHMDQTLDEKDLPVRYFAFTPAFRREAGSYGKDTKGILRLHQFDKIEMESFTDSKNGLNEQNFFVGIQEYLMQSLEIPYQVVAICTGDMGSPDYRQIDIESWMPGENKYRETHTSDYMTDYQSRRLGTKVKNENGETEFAHMNDATAFAIGRTIIAILENYQQKDGSVLIPKVLQKYLGKDRITPKS